MSRKKRPRSKKTNGRPATFTVKVPRGLNIPRILYAPPVNQRQRMRRHITIPLVTKPQRSKRVKVKVYQQRDGRGLKPSYTAIDRHGRLKIYSRRKTERLLKHETHRKRQDRKPNNRRETGHLSSIRRDTYGIIGINRGGTPTQIALAAMLTRALGG